MRRIGRAARVLALAVLASGLLAARAEDNPKPSPQAVDPVDRVLEEWQRKASTVKSIELRFKWIANSPGWDQTRGAGRVVLAAPDLALVETSPVGKDGKATAIDSRIIWSGRSRLNFDPEKHTVDRVRLPDEWPSPPDFLRLPFLFMMSIDDAKRDHDWTLLREDREHIQINVIPKPKPNKKFSLLDLANADVSPCVIELDRKTFQVTRLLSYRPNRRDWTEYEVVERKINRLSDFDELREPCLDAWVLREKQ